MTLLEGHFSYGRAPSERELRALDRVRLVYGVRKISFDQNAHMVRLEYDASRLSESDMTGLLRAAGVDVQIKPALAA
jgi:hypothetical protein